MLESLKYRPYFTQMGAIRLTVMERKLLEISREPAENTWLSPFPYTVMGFLNGKFGNSGKARIKIYTPLSKTVFVNASEIRHWLILVAVDYSNNQNVLKYYNVPEDFHPSYDNFNRIVPPISFFEEHIDFSLSPHQVTFNFEQATMEIFHETRHQNSYRGLVLV